MEKIAIIGTGCILPGYTTKEQLWDRMMEGKCFLSEEDYNGKTIERGHLYKKNSDEFFGKYFSDEKLEILNRKGEIYKWSTYVVEEALKESGYISNEQVLKNTGIIMGTLGMFVPEYISMFDSLVKAKIENNINLLLKDEKFKFHNSNFNEKISKDKCYVDTDNIKTIVDMFGLGKTSISMSAACSTPLYAIKLACLYLQTHKADMMVVGSNCENESVSDVCGIFDLLSILTERGTCNPLNKNTQGLIISSGAGAVVLKRLDDAIRDCDTILSVIDSIGWSNDGGEKSLLAPCKEGQIASYKDAYKNGINDDIDYIECHSTGTAAGDLEEYKSITSYFYDRGKNPLIGTLKGNAGHFLTASAMGSLIKVILSMQKSIIPKTIRISDPVGKEVVTKNTEWPRKGREKRAAVNAFGFGGINAHLVLKEYTGKKEHVDKIEQKQKDKIVVTGMELMVGQIQNKEKLFECLVNGQTIVSDNIGNRFSQDNKSANVLNALGLSEFPKGAYIHEIPFDLMKFKFATKNNLYYARRDMFLMNIANRALAEANITVDSLTETAVIVNAGQDFAVLNYRTSEELQKQLLESFEQSCKDVSEAERREILGLIRTDEQSVESGDSIVGIIPSIRGSRISAHWHFKGPSFVLTEQEEALKHSLDLARIFLEQKLVKCVVIGTIELLGETEFLYAEKLNGNLDKIKKYGIGEGAAVLVLKTEQDAVNAKDTIYGDIDDVQEANEKWPENMIDTTMGYSVSLRNYIELIVRMMEKHYGYSVGQKKFNQGSPKELFDMLHCNAVNNDEKLKNESKRSFIKIIPTSRPEISKRDAFKEHIHQFGPEKKELVFSTVKEYKDNIYQDNYESFLQYLKQKENELEEYFKNEIPIEQKNYIWDREEIVEMTNGSMSKVLGKKYNKIDEYQVRSRMPSPPYLFVSRITKLDAAFGELRPSSVEIEYDVDSQCIYLQGDRTIANVVYTEASQIGIFLGSYIGADLTKDGTLRFRVVDSKITITSNKPVHQGETLRLVYQMKNFAKRGETLIVFCSYECYKGDTMLLKTDAIGGFFTEEDLKGSKGLISPKIKLGNQMSSKSYKVKKLRDKRTYNQTEMEHFFNGELRECFEDSEMSALNPQLYIRKEVRMLDAVNDISCTGGKYGLGYIKGEKNIDESHWAFQAHFKNDPVFPGTLILNGANELLMFYVMHFGFFNGDVRKKPRTMEGLTVNVKFAGQVRPERSTIVYSIDIKEVFGQDNVESLVAEVNVYWKDINVIREDNVSLKF
jgi:3-oxoacyl-(acyl-carrier-protein) synthase/3-hydroxymyristoyl/3-hydroxydecanoyl-(acyl carrier protein) dehydratase